MFTPLKLKTLIHPPQNFEKHIRLPPYRDRGSARSASARRRGGDKFESRADITKDVKIVSTAAISNARHI